MRLKQIVVGTSAVLFVAGGLLLAQGPGFGRMGASQFGVMREMVAAALDLSDAQKEQAKAIFDAARQAAQPLREQMKQGHDEMSTAVKAGDAQSIDTLAQSQGVLAGRLIAVRAKAFSDFYRILTPEQKQKAEKIHSQMRGMFERRMAKP